MADDFLNERTRAEDIILGALGFDSDASIRTVMLVDEGFTGTGVWSDGEEFEFESDEELTDIERWAIEILTKESTDGKEA